MCPDIRRLKTRREFLRVAGARRKRVRAGLVLQAARRKCPPSPPAPETKRQGPDGGPACEGQGVIGVGFTASRKVGTAVERNRARRRLRAAAAEVIPVHGEAGTDYVLIARKATLKRKYSDLVGDLREALRQLDQDTKRNSEASRLDRMASSGRASRPGASS